jgi:hypothetical protein
VDHPPCAPESGALQSNPHDALATPPAAYGDAMPDTPAYCKHVAVCQLDYREGTSDDRHNKDASGQKA